MRAFLNVDTNCLSEHTHNELGFFPTDLQTVRGLVPERF